MEAAPEPEAGAALTIHDLPDALLARIFEKAGPPARRAAGSVSRRWHGALFAAPEVWRVTHLRFRSDYGTSPEQLGAMLAGKRRLLKRQAALVQVLILSGSVDALGSKASPPCTIADLLSCLSPGSLTAVHLMDQDVSAAAIAQLQRYPQLHLLEIVQRQLDLPAELDPAVLAEVARLATLRRLSITAGALPPLQPLTALTGIQKLRVQEAWSRDAARWGISYTPVDMLSPTAFPQADFFQVAAHRIKVAPSMLVNGMDRGPAGIKLSGKSPIVTCDDLALFLESCHDGLLSSGSLHSVLQAVLPPAAQLRVLSLASCAVEETTFSGCTELSGVTTLHLQQIYAIATTCGMMEHNPVYCLSQLLAQMPALQQLQFVDCDMLAGLPPSVTGHSQLQALVAHHCSVRDIPAGPYLAGLTRLSIVAHPSSADPTMERLPAALESATELRTLDLSYHYGLKLGAAAADLLAALPHLQQLKLSGVRVHEAFRGRLAERRPDVQLLTS